MTQAFTTPLPLAAIKRYGLPVLLYLGGYLCLKLAAPEHTLGAATIAPWNAAPVLGVALVFRRGLTWAPLTLLAPLLAWLVGSPPAGTSGPVTAAIIEALTMSAAGWALQQVDFHGQMNRLRDVLTLIVLAVAAATIMAWCETAIYVVNDSPSPTWSGLGAVAVPVFLSNIVALTSVLPAVLIFSRPRPLPTWRRLLSIEAILQMSALLVISWEVFVRFVNAELHFFYLLFLPFAWIASRRGQRTTVVALTACYGALVTSDWLIGHEAETIFDLELRFLALAATSLALGAATSERRAAEARMQARQAELAYVLRLNVGWEMASALAHELNQPLSAAMNYCQAARNLLRGEKPDTARAATIIDQGIDRIEHLGNIVRGLRDFMKKGEMSMLRTDLADTVAEALRLLEGEASVGDIDLRADGLQALPKVLADKTQIAQVLVNLIRNAIQAITASGEINGRIAIEAQQNDNQVEVTVSDNGPGLEDEIAEHIFEPFVTASGDGMGLGLSIVKSIVEAHGGRVWCTTGPKGTVFGFSLLTAPE
jgi:two-component system sensor kinase FixL